MNRFTRFLPLLSTAALLGACATVPKPLQGEFTVVSARDISANGRTGDAVRWGGIIIDVEPEASRTCLQVLSRELSDAARPRDRDISEGRFLACREGFYDPEIFTKGREVTVAGRVNSVVQRQVGEYAYPMPEVAADVIYLWPERPQYEMNYWDSPWYGPWGPHYRSWYGPFYRPYPIVRPRPHPRKGE